jgi:hypothetical protein|tara:strand:- start:1316 stop:1519 length:204 start_codon:yes stop_codon:yes gene_type:complete
MVNGRRFSEVLMGQFSGTVRLDGGRFSLVDRGGEGAKKFYCNLSVFLFENPLPSVSLCVTLKPANNL